jgi:hypothetical protein
MGTCNDSDFRGVSGLLRSLDIPRLCRTPARLTKAGFVFF